LPQRLVLVVFLVLRRGRPGRLAGLDGFSIGWRFADGRRGVLRLCVLRLRLR
jgi:hypothetical protein